MKNSKKLGHLIRLTCLAGAVFCYSAAGYAAVMANTALPEGGKVVAGGGKINQAGNIMNITGLNSSVIKWQDFNIGSVATVNFSGDKNFNVLNYVNGGNMSQIHGTLNAQGGNVYLVNPAGVFIGKSAQIDVGSLYVSNKKIDGLEGNGKLGFDAAKAALTKAAPSGAELMSLGHINATNVTFDGNRIVLDTEYVTNGIDTPIGADKINIITPQKDLKNADVVLGYEAYKNNTYAGANTNDKLANYNGNGSITKADGYMWIENVEQLQAMNTNVKGNYALRNGIDATNTAENAFTAVGDSSQDGAFKGKLDGLAGRVEGVDFAIFDLHVGDKTTLGDNVGLFGVTKGATLKNLTFVSGSATGQNNVGMLVGSATNTTIENITSSAEVTGGQAATIVTGTNIGGIVGSASGKTTMSDLLNTGAVSGYANVGGVVGSMTNNSKLTDARNLGQIRGEYGDPKYAPQKPAHKYELYYSHNIGGLVGNAEKAELSDLQNDMTVIGGYNVGGIVGKGENIKLDASTNTADVTANGYVADTYKYIKYNTNVWHSTETTKRYEKDKDDLWVKLANVGGVVGNVTGNSKLDGVTNDGGNVASSKVEGQDYYEAGNIGGIAGYVKGTENDENDENVIITNAVNKENTVYGSHNVGGIAGYLENGSVKIATNNGGDIMATGAYGSGKHREEYLGGRNTHATYIGNIGGIVGYMYGDNTSISQSGNRGTVHSMYFEDPDNVPEAAQAANVGGIVGKVARLTSDKQLSDEELLNKLNGRIEDIKKDPTTAAISDCYNTGDVQGFTGVGGIAGQMYNGEVTGSYNLGHIQTTQRRADGIIPVNMGGIVGESSEKTDARVIVYDVYNSGVIGSENFEFYARHVGGVVGRLAGYVEKAYNTGAIYNGSNVVGGVVGYVDYGNIKDCFNTGNVTVINRNTGSSATGGVVGGYDVRGFDLTIENVYNLGTVRSFKYDSHSGENYVGGIIGRILDHDYDINQGSGCHLTIKNAYTLGNIYAGTYDGTDNYKIDEEAYVGAIYGGFNELNESHVTTSKAYYIAPESDAFQDLSTSNYAHYTLNYDPKKTNVKAIAFEKRMDPDSYKNSVTLGNDFVFSDSNGSDGSEVEVRRVDEQTGNTVEFPWRIYEGSTTPILNAFLPDAEKYFSNDDNYEGGSVDLAQKNIASLQYGTAYNPTLTIINAAEDSAGNAATITLDWSAMKIDKGASFAVNKGSLTINNFDTKGNYFGGTLYADGALNIYNTVITDTNNGNIMLGSGSKLYGSSIDVESAGVLTGYGSVQSTGKSGSADITLSGDAGVEIIGTVKSAAEKEEILVEGVDSTPKVSDINVENKLDAQIKDNIANPYKAMPDVADYYGKIVKSGASGNVEITSAKGDVDVLFGVAEKGYVQSAGSITLEGNSVYVDSDVKFGDKLTFTADEAVLDISNIGKVQVTRQDENSQNTAVNYLHSFLAQGDKLSFVGKTTTTPDAIIAVDMSKADDNGQFDLKQYNITGETFSDATKKLGDNQSKIHIWLENAEQLQGINEYYKNDTDSKIFEYQFALKNDIDANDLKNFQGIGYGVETDGTNRTNKSFVGSLDGRGHSIIGLNVEGNSSSENDYVGLFSQIGTNGSVKDLNIISSDFTGSSVGAVAGLNQGKIDNVTTFGNRVESDEYVTTNIFGDAGHGVGAAGGITGINEGTISNVTASDAVIAGVGGDDNHTYDSTAGGIAGVNVANIKSSTTNSAITCSSGDANALGGVAGINYGKDALLNIIESWGILNGKYKGLNNSGNEEIRSTENVGGIAGVNYNGASITNAYNEAHLVGSNGVGGIVGYSGSDNDDAQNTITYAVNAGNITGSAEGLTSGTKVQNTGGVVGNNQNTTITYARNTGTIHGEDNVGGMVGTNGVNSKLNHVTNDGSAAIYGETNVGGIAGVNKGSIDAEGSDLTNNGTIHGKKYVGGVAGVNDGGTIRYMNSNITLYATDDKAEYFGGVAGHNKGTITNATNTGYVNAEQAKYVGGIAGMNDATGKITGAGNANSGEIVGEDYVGGVVGLNKGEISGTAAEPTTVRNYGYVHAVSGGAGGIIGVNEIALTNVTMINGGVVYGVGNSGTGGVIGVNYGDISKSDVIGEIGAVVVAKENVGGLIGTNYASVTGGRDNGDNYYAHQVYNNGTVVGGAYSENTGDVAVTDAAGKVIGYYTVATDSSNIGGVVGNNAVDKTDPANVKTGVLTAAYNTGKVLGGANAGGVVGNNDGTVQQVFNAGTVNVGTNQKVIGKQGAGSQAFDYYDISGSEYSVDNDIVWKSYDGGNKYGYNKLLKVFLTKIKFVQTADAQLIADGQQSIVVRAVGDTVNVYTQDAAGKEIQIGYIQAVDPKGAHSMADYLSSMDQDGLNGLLSGKAFDSTGTYNLFTTQQINIVDKSHNNLGYDIEPLTVKVVQLPPTIDPNDPRYYDLWEAEDKYPWYQWDKQRNERERKAEVHFVDGGMAIH